VLGEREAVVVGVAPWDVHGVSYVDVSVAYPDGSVDTARLGQESIPHDLRPGERVRVSTAVNMIVSLSRADTPG
jgi:hypothetical protein